MMVLENLLWGTKSMKWSDFASLFGRATFSLIFFSTCYSQTAQLLPSQISESEQYFWVTNAIARKDFAEALAHGSRLIERSDKYDQAYSKIVEAAAAGALLEEAKVLFESLLKRPNPNYKGYYGLGLISAQQEDFSSAIEFYKKCIKELPDFFQPIQEMVNTYSSKKNIAEAMTYLESLLRSNPQSSVVHLGVGYVHHKNRSIDEAIKEMDISLQLDPGLIDACYNKARVLWLGRKYKRSLEAIEQCLPNIKQKLNEDHQQQFLNIIVANHISLGNTSKALITIEEALALARKMGDSEYEAVCLAYRANAYELEDKYSLALLNYKHAFEIASKKPFHGVAYNLTRLAVNTGRIYLLLGDYASALLYFRHCLEIAKESNNKDAEAAAYFYIGDVFLAQNNVAQAIKHYQSVDENLSNPLLKNRAYDVLSVLYLSMGEYQKAGEMIQQSLSLAASLSNFEIQLSSLNSLGQLQLKMNSPEQSASTYQQAMELAFDKGRLRQAWIASAGLANAYNKLERQGDARKYYLQATKLMEDMRASLAIEEERATFFNDKIQVYKNLIPVLMRLHNESRVNGYADEAFDYAERARGRAFLDLLAEAKVNLDQNLDPALLEKRQIIQNELSRINSELVAERSKELSKQDVNKLKLSEKALSDADERLDNWVRDVRLSDPRYAALKFPEPIKLSEAQKLLDERSAMLAFSLGEQESFLFAVTRNDYRIFKLKSSATIRRNVDDLLNAIHGKGRANSPIGTFKTSARELYQSLIEPAKEMLAGKSELIVIPDESLHRLPFETLLTAQPDGKWEQLPYLVRDFAISYAPSVSVLAFLKTQSHRVTPKDFIAFGDPVFGKDDQMNDQTKMLASTTSNNRGLSVKPERPGFWRKLFGSSTRGASTGPLKFDRLPFSRDEAIEIAKLFSTGKADVFLDKDATEEKAKTKDLLGQYGIVHFSTHGLPNEDRPRFSSLIMSSPTKGKTASETIEDGWLSAYEIFNLKLNANLVVLSACETGLGKEIKGEGLMSLTRAFMYAGAPSVVVSLWKVNDSASKDLMVAFYRNLQQPVNGEKLSYSEALRRAQLEMIAKGNAPKLWAPFVLIGRP